MGRPLLLPLLLLSVQTCIPGTAWASKPLRWALGPDRREEGEGRGAQRRMSWRRGAQSPALPLT